MQRTAHRGNHCHANSLPIYTYRTENTVAKSGTGCELPRPHGHELELNTVAMTRVSCKKHINKTTQLPCDPPVYRAHFMHGGAETATEPLHGSAETATELLHS